jgi:hypothetical protein
MADEERRLSNEDKELLAQIRGKTNRSFANELFAQVNNVFYEFGLLGKNYGPPGVGNARPDREREPERTE